MDAQDQNNREEFKCAEPQEFTSTHDTPPPGLPHEPPAGNVSDPERDIDPDLHEQQLDLEPNELELVSEEKPEFSETERRISEVEPEINNNAIEDTVDVEEPVPAYSKINDDDFATVELDGKFFHSFKPCVHAFHLITTDVFLQVLENCFEVVIEAT